MLNQEIKNKIAKLWDMFWSGGISNPITALEQISYLLFLRRAEDVGLIKVNKYKWSVYTKQIRYQANLPEYIKRVFDHIKNINSKQESFRLAMKGANLEISKLSLLMAAIELIDQIYLEAEKERKAGQHFQDTLGDFYEHILKQTSEAGKNGQFRTPRHIIQLMCEILEPNINDTICDIAVGTSGFLIGAYQFIIKQNSNEKGIIDENGFEKKTSGNKIRSGSIKEKKLTEGTFFGYDIDTTMIRLGVMNLLMHNIKKPNIKHLDALSQKFDKVEKGIQYSKILANPPFTGRIDSLEATSTSEIYPLNRKGNEKIKQTIQSEILFLERIIQLLKIDGRAAVIVPEGLLFGSAKAPTLIRKMLLTNCSLDAVISLPSGVFLPYTGVKTSILIFTKKQFIRNHFHTKKVWFYGLDSDGYSLDTNRRLLMEKPLPKVRDAFSNRNLNGNDNKKSNHFFVSLEDIIENGFQLSFNQYKLFVPENRIYEEPKVLLERLLDMERQIFSEMEELTKLLN